MPVSDALSFLQSKVPLFADFPAPRLGDLVDKSQLITFEPQEAVVEFGEEGRFLGVLLDGQAEVAITDDSGEKHRLNVLSSGDIFGEMSMMTGDKSVADVIVEIAMTEQFRLGIQPPVRESGDLRGTPAITLEGPTGTITLDHGVICALRHIHMPPQDALRFGVRDRHMVRVRIAGDRELVFGDVLVRVSPTHKLSMHLDTDEANAAGIATGVQDSPSRLTPHPPSAPLPAHGGSNLPSDLANCTPRAAGGSHRGSAACRVIQSQHGKALYCLRWATGTAA